jgi:hypothetical protein
MEHAMGCTESSAPACAHQPESPDNLTADQLDAVLRVVLREIGFSDEEIERELAKPEPGQ